MVDRNSLNQLLKILIGNRFGEDPAAHLETIRSEKMEFAHGITQLLDLQKNDRVLEIGVGGGWAGVVFAPQVKHYYGADISEPFVAMANEELSSFENALVQKIPYGNLSLFKGHKINKIFARDLFTQFGFHDHVIYLKEVFRILENDGLFYFNFLNADFLDVCSNPKFLRHNKFYLEDQSKSHLLNHWISLTTIEQFAKNIGFSVMDRCSQPDISWLLLKKETTQ